MTHTINSSEIDAKRKVGHVSGSLSIYEDEDMRYLKSVEKDLSINSDYKYELKLNNLEYVGGDIYIIDNKRVEMNNLRTVGGKMWIQDDASLQANKLITIAGDLHIFGPAKLDSLQSIGGSLYVQWGVKLNNLIAIGGNLYLRSLYKIETLNLQYLYGEIYCSSTDHYDLNDAILNRRIITWRNADSSYLSTRLPAKKHNNYYGGPRWTISKRQDHEKPAESRYCIRLP